MVRGKREKRKMPNKNKLGLLINHYSNTTTLEITNLYITQSSIKRTIFSALIKKYIEKKLDQTEPRLSNVFCCIWPALKLFQTSMRQMNCPYSGLLVSYSVCYLTFFLFLFFLLAFFKDNVVATRCILAIIE